jgi:hypothetical protein
MVQKTFKRHAHVDHLPADYLLCFCNCNSGNHKFFAGLMKTLLNKWFIAGCLTWLVVFIMRKLHHPLPYLNGYITDAAALPVIANLGLWFQRVIIIKNNYYVLSVWHVVFITAYVSVLFEGLLPLISKNYTADWIDVILYIIGGIFFNKVMNKPLIEVRDL